MVKQLIILFLFAGMFVNAPTETRAENWELVHHAIEMLWDDYFYIDWDAYERKEDIAVFKMRVSVYEDPVRANEELLVSLHCRESVRTVLRYQSFNPNLSGSDYHVGFPKPIADLAPAPRESWQAILKAVCSQE